MSLMTHASQYIQKSGDLAGSDGVMLHVSTVLSTITNRITAKSECNYNA
jgi:hypothetical protein